MPPATGRQNGPAGGISCAYPSPSLVETYLPAARRSDCDSSGTVRDFHPASPVGGPASAGPPLRPGIQKSVLLFAPRMTPCAFKGGCRPGISQTGRAALRPLYHTLPRRTSRSRRCANAAGCQIGERRAWRADDGRGAPLRCVRADARIAPRRAWRETGAYLSPPASGRNVGRAISPAAWGLRYRRVCGTMRASSPTDAGQGAAGFCRISPAQSGNAPLRLRLAAQPPSGLRCPHRAACAEARLCSATVKPAPSRFLRRRRRSTPQPLAGEAL